MKKVIHTALLLGFSTGLFAEINKGAIAVTGTVGMNGSKNSSESLDLSTSMVTINNDQKTRAFAFVPAISYFVKNNIEAGIAVAIMRNKTMNDFHPPAGIPFATKTQEVINPLTAYGIFGNYYLVQQKMYSFYAGLQLGMGSGKGTVTNTAVNGMSNKVTTKNNGSTFGLNAGFMYFVTSNLALNANLGLLSFNTVKTESTSNNVTTNTKSSNWVFGVNGVIVNIGVKFLLMNKGAEAAK